jgi:hypothetical protein
MNSMSARALYSKWVAERLEGVHQVAVTIANNAVPPAVAIRSSANGSTVGGSVRVRSFATDNQKVAKISLSIDARRWPCPTAHRSASTGAEVDIHREGGWQRLRDHLGLPHAEGRRGRCRRQDGFPVDRGGIAVSGTGPPCQDSVAGADNEPGGSAACGGARPPPWRRWGPLGKTARPTPSGCFSRRTPARRLRSGRPSWLSAAGAGDLSGEASRIPGADAP